MVRQDPRWFAVLAVGLAALCVGLAASPLFAQSFRPRTHKCPPCLGIANTFVRADIGPNGTWVLGTTGGDPDTAADDDKNLLYGFEPGSTSSVGSSYTTVRIAGPKGTVNEVHLDNAPQSQNGNRVATRWTWASPYQVQVTQTVEIQQNPFSGRPDVVGMRYDMVNLDAIPVAIGVRALLDIKLGQNDGAPYFVPGVGTVTTEREFGGAQVPAYWLAFESPTYDPSLLRSVGVLRGREVTTPDRLIIARWRYIQYEKWDYPIDATKPVTADSAVAVYWDPVSLPPGGRRTVSTSYGLTTNRGGSAFVSAPVEAQCGDTISAAIFVNNFDTAPLTGGQATIRLPAGLTLAPGESATKPLPEIPPGGTGSAAWSVRLAIPLTGSFSIDASASFDGGKQFAASTNLNVTCPAPTITPTSHPPSPTATPMPTPTRTAVPSPTPSGPIADACDYILSRVPAAVISHALANPWEIWGWMQPNNSALPPGPSNPLRTHLSMRNLGTVYHPLSNPVIYKAGCP